MSWLGRLRRAFRSETQLRLYNYTSDQTTPKTFVSDLVDGEFTNKNEWTNLLKVAQEDPIGYRVCVLLSHNVFDDWFVIKKKSDDEDTPTEELEEHPLNKQIQEEFNRMNAKFYFTEAAIAESIFGHSALVFNYNRHRYDVEGEGYQVATLDVFSDENMQVPSHAFDPMTGTPDYIEVWHSPDVTYADPDRIPWADVQWWVTRPKGRSIFGYSAMHSAWDLMTYLRESVDAMAWSHKKYGIGVFAATVKGSLSTEKKEALESAMQDLSSRRGLVLESDDWDGVEWIGPPSSGTTNIVEGNDFLLGLISSATGIPKDIFTGVSAGAITGSEINNKALYATINKRQSNYEENVLDTIYRMGYDNSDMVISWNTRYATDELEQAQIRNLNADAMLKEAQAERGDIMIGIQQEGFKDQEQTNNPTGMQ